MTIATTSQIWEASGGILQKYVFNPEGYGIERSSLDNLRGGDAEYNASVFRAVLAGEGESAKDSLHAIRNAVLINAAAGLIAYRKTTAGVLRNGTQKPWRMHANLLILGQQLKF